ncbi:Cysteine-rich motor neuron 1 protein, partial [Trichinella nativa]
LACSSRQALTISYYFYQRIGTSTLDPNMLNCSAPSLYHGCSLFLKHGCSCLTVKSCQQAHFQFSDEAICHEEWIRRKTMWKEVCLKAKCGVVFQPKCPEDSILVPAPAPEPPNCCPSPDTCQCNQEACLKHIKSCPPESELVRVSEGTDTPGRCCDIFECFPKKFGCNHVRCPPTKVEKCPEDSYRPPQVIAEKGCCPVVEECRCLAGVCPPAVCPPNHHLVVLKKGNGIPGSCCDQFHCISVEPAVNETSMICEVEKTVFHNGDTWHPKPCTECECKDGIIFCRSLLCHPPPPSCRRIQVPEGECCPICSGCETENGESRNITEQWKKDDCTTCQCSEDGQVICQRQLCSVECDNPLYVSGQCCPVCEKSLLINLPLSCPSIELCTLRCEYGLKRGLDGCFLCECQQNLQHLSGAEDEHHGNFMSVKISDPITAGKVEVLPLEPGSKSGCQFWNLQSCTKRCAHGFEHDANGCPMCKCNACPRIYNCNKHCLYGYEKNLHGCEICRCRGIWIESDSSVFPTKNITSEWIGCSSLAGYRDHGEWWFDDCRHCYCDHGREFCSLLACPHLNCTEPTFIDGECCPRCPDAALDRRLHRLTCHAPGGNRNYVEGEFWNLDKCTICTCHVGHVLCHRKECPPAPCAKPSISDDNCCPVCKDVGFGEFTPPANISSFCSTETGVAHVEGSVWKEGPCVSCVCRHSQVRCYYQSCASVTCDSRSLHLKDSCCPICIEKMDTGVCHLNGVSYNIGEMWRDNICRNCTCQYGGELFCSQMECRKCVEPIYKEGLCCPVCKEMTNWQVLPNYPKLNDNSTDVQQASLVVALCIIGILAVVLLIVLLVVWLAKKYRAPAITKSTEARLSSLKFQQGKSLLKHIKRNGAYKQRKNVSLLRETGGSCEEPECASDAAV